MLTPNPAVIFEKVPVGAPVPGQDLVLRQDRSIDLDAPLEKGSLIIRNKCISFDPYQRGRLRDPSIKSYSPAFDLGKPLTNSGIAVIAKSAASTFSEGDLVEVDVVCGFEEYTLLPAALVETRVKKLVNPHNLAPEHFLHSLGMPGLTAYAGLYEIGGPLTAGETIFVSSAAGAVGQVVGAIAKRNGLTVLGSVGSQEKLDFLINECGFDGGFNYKEEKPKDALARLAPEGINIYFENVGGEHLEAVLDNIQPFGKIIFCGMVSQYNLKPEDAYPIRNLTNFVRKRIKAQGFIVGDKGFRDKYQEEHREVVSKWIVEGSFKPKIDVTQGVDNAIDGFLGMLQGKNFGKAVLNI